MGGCRKKIILGLGGQIVLISELENQPSQKKKLFTLAEQNYLIKSKIDNIRKLDDYKQHKIRSVLDKTLKLSLKERLNKPYKFDTRSKKI